MTSFNTHTNKAVIHNMLCNNKYRGHIIFSEDLKNNGYNVICVLDGECPLSLWKDYIKTLDNSFIKYNSSCNSLICVGSMITSYNSNINYGMLLLTYSYITKRLNLVCDKQEEPDNDMYIIRGWIPKV